MKPHTRQEIIVTSFNTGLVAHTSVWAARRPSLLAAGAVVGAQSDPAGSAAPTQSRGEGHEASQVTPPASSSGRNRPRTWLGRTPRKQKEQRPQQGLPPPQHRAVQEPRCSKDSPALPPAPSTRPGALVNPTQSAGPPGPATQMGDGTPAAERALPSCTGSSTLNLQALTDKTKALLSKHRVPGARTKERNATCLLGSPAAR